MEVKRFVASMYIIGSNACKSLGNKDIISEDPVELARDYIENNVDELLIFDLSKDELDKEKAHQIIMDIIKLDEVSVSVAGNIAVIEDANRLLDNGCAHVVLNCTRESNIDMLTELSVKYGYEKISAAITNIDQYLGNRDLIEEFTSRLVIMQEDVTRDILKKSVVPMLIPLADIPLERLIDFLEKDAIIGVFGTVVNSNIHELNGIKMLCSEKGIRVNGFDALLSFDELKKNSDGLVPCIVQDYKNGDVLMMAYMNEEAYNATIRTGRMNYYSRSRNSQWLKGETSGHFQYVKSLYADCDKDTLLAKVSQVGAACHTGSRSCFFNEVIIRQ